MLEFVDGAHTLLKLRGRQHRFERPEDRERPSAQGAAFVLRNAEQVADQLYRDGGRQVIDDVDDAALRRRIEQPVNQRFDARLERLQRPRRKDRGEQPADPRVDRRVVEHEARRVMFVERAVGKFRFEIDLLVRAPGRGIVIDRHEVVVAGQEKRSIGQAVDRRELAQGSVCRIRVIEEGEHRDD